MVILCLKNSIVYLINRYNCDGEINVSERTLIFALGSFSFRMVCCNRECVSKGIGFDRGMSACMFIIVCVRSVGKRRKDENI